MRNPGGGKLQDVLPPELYARWSRLKTRYLGRDRGIEKKRPVIATFQLYQAALRHHGLRGGVVRPVVAPVLEARGLKPVSTTLELTVDDPRQALAEFRAEPARQEDLDCVARTLDLIEHGLPQVSRRANAWATGDVAALRAMPEAGNQTLACLTARTGTGTARRRGFTDLDRQVRERWLEAALAALDGHPVSFAMLPIDSLLHDRGGYVSALQARGCQVHAADEEYDGEESLPGPGNTAAAGVGTRAPPPCGGGAGRRITPQRRGAGWPRPAAASGAARRHGCRRHRCRPRPAGPRGWRGAGRHPAGPAAAPPWRCLRH